MKAKNLCETLGEELMQSKWQKEKETKIITKESQDYEIV